MGKPVYNARRRRRRHNRLVLIGIAALILLLLGVILLRSCHTEEKPGEDTPPPDQPQATLPVVSMPLPQSFVDQNTASSYIVLYDLTSDKQLYGKNAEERCYPASMTKLLTALVTIESVPADTVFTVGDEIRLIDPESSVARLRIGNRLDLQTLIEALLLPSGNDAAYTAAANVGRILAGDESLPTQEAIRRFCDKMNEKATALGAIKSHFANPDGIHSDNHYTTAADMLKIAKAAYAQPLIAKAASEEKVTRTFLSGETGATWYNTNYLLRSDNRLHYEYATGLKTGHTDKAGYCLAATAEYNGVKLMTILAGSSSNTGRFEDAIGLFDVCFDSAIFPAELTDTTQPAA